jgi:hypothetical protein
VVSGSVSSPSRGPFHLSLTVLVRYRSPKFFSLGGWSPQLPTSLLVARGTQEQQPPAWKVLYWTLTGSGGAFQPLRVFRCMRVCRCPTTPPRPKTKRFGLFPVRSPLLRESRLISFRQATEMFQFAHVPPSLPMCSAGGLQASPCRSCLIRNLGVHSLYAAPPERFAGLRVLLRSLAPRHPPRTLSHLCASPSASREASTSKALGARVLVCVSCGNLTDLRDQMGSLIDHLGWACAPSVGGSVMFL